MWSLINDVIMEETCDKNPTMQIKINKNLEGKNEQLMYNNIKIYMCKGKLKNPLEEVHYVGLFIVLMIIQMLILKISINYDLYTLSQ